MSVTTGVVDLWTSPGSLHLAIEVFCRVTRQTVRASD